MSQILKVIEELGEQEDADDLLRAVRDLKESRAGRMVRELVDNSFEIAKAQMFEVVTPETIHIHNYWLGQFEAFRALVDILEDPMKIVKEQFSFVNKERREAREKFAEYSAQNSREGV